MTLKQDFGNDFDRRKCSGAPVWLEIRVRKPGIRAYLAKDRG